MKRISSVRLAAIVILLCCGCASPKGVRESWTPFSTFSRTYSFDAAPVAPGEWRAAVSGIPEDADHFSLHYAGPAEDLAGLTLEVLDREGTRLYSQAPGVKWTRMSGTGWPVPVYRPNDLFREGGTFPRSGVTFRLTGHGPSEGEPLKLSLSRLNPTAR